MNPDRWLDRHARSFGLTLAGLVLGLAAGSFAAAFVLAALLTAAFR